MVHRWGVVAAANSATIGVTSSLGLSWLAAKGVTVKGAAAVVLNVAGWAGGVCFARCGELPNSRAYRVPAERLVRCSCPSELVVESQPSLGVELVRSCGNDGLVSQELLDAVWGSG